MLTSLILAVWLGSQIPNISANLNLLSSNQQTQVDYGQPHVAAVDAQSNDSTYFTSATEKKITSDEEPALVAQKARNLSSKAISTEKVVIASEVTSKISEKKAKAKITDTPVVSYGGLLENRLEATGKWMATIKDNQYSVQLFLARKNGRAAIEEFLGNVPESLDFNKIYIYETLINKQAMYSVIYDDFTSFSKAVEVINGISNDFQINKPFVRRVSDFRRVIDLQETVTIKDMDTNVTLNNSVNR